jgi:hypothetical protein
MRRSRKPWAAAAGSGLLALTSGAAEAQPAGPLPAHALAAAPLIAAAPAVVLTNGAIEARVLTPDADKGFYRGTRFDWSGVIASLTYRGQEFYGPWFSHTAASVRDFAYTEAGIVAGPHSAATGPVDEFDTARPLGWDEAGPGGVFVKIGVGALRRPDAEAYAPYRSYEIVDPGRRTLKASRAAVTFTHDLASAEAGYGYSYEKTISLVRNQPRMVIAHRLRNTGPRPITTVVYNHNFLTFGGAGMSRGLTVSAPYQITSSRPSEPPLAELREGKLIYVKTLEDRERIFMPIEGFGADPADNALRIVDERTGAAVTFQGDWPLTRIQLWSIRSVISTEPFTTLSIPPGGEVQWRYSYLYEVPSR